MSVPLFSLIQTQFFIVVNHQINAVTNPALWKLLQNYYLRYHTFFAILLIFKNFAGIYFTNFDLSFFMNWNSKP